MIAEVIQCVQNPYFCEFQIVRGSKQIGGTYLRGRLGRREATWDIRFLDCAFQLSYCGGFFSSAKRFRPYKIVQNHEDIGCIYQTVSSDKLRDSFTYQTMEYDGDTYDLFPIGFGEEGVRCPVYSNQKQIAQIEKSNEVYNALHSYRLYAMDEESMIPAVFFCSHMYLLGCYEPGRKVIKSVEKNFNMTKNGILLAKYDKNFTASIWE